MRFYAFLAAAAVYYGVGYRLTSVAFRHHVRPNDPHNFTDIWSAQNFRSEGEARRRRAVAWWAWGLPVMVVLLVVL